MTYPGLVDVSCIQQNRRVFSWSPLCFQVGVPILRGEVGGCVLRQLIWPCNYSPAQGDHLLQIASGMSVQLKRKARVAIYIECMKVDIKGILAYSPFSINAEVLYLTNLGCPTESHNEHLCKHIQFIST